MVEASLLRRPTSLVHEVRDSLEQQLHFFLASKAGQGQCRQRLGNPISRPRDDGKAGASTRRLSTANHFEAEIGIQESRMRENFVDVQLELIKSGRPKLKTAEVALNFRSATNGRSKIRTSFCVTIGDCVEMVLEGLRSFVGYGPTSTCSVCQIRRWSDAQRLLEPNTQRSMGVVMIDADARLNEDVAPHGGAAPEEDSFVRTSEISRGRLICTELCGRVAIALQGKTQN